MAVVAMPAVAEVARAQTNGAVPDSTLAGTHDRRPRSLSAGLAVVNRFFGDDHFGSIPGVSTKLRLSPEAALQALFHFSDYVPVALTLRYQRYFRHFEGAGVFAHVGATASRLPLAEGGLGAEWLLHDRLGVTADLGLGVLLPHGCCVYSSSLSLHYRFAAERLGSRQPGPVGDPADARRHWFRFAYGLRFETKCTESEWSCILLPGASLQVDLGSRLALQGSAHTLWTLEDLGKFNQFTGRAKLYVTGGPEEGRLFMYGMMGLQPWNRGNTFRNRALGIGWEWVASARTRSSVDLGVLQSTNFAAEYQLVIGADIHMRMGS